MAFLPFADVTKKDDRGNATYKVDHWGFIVEMGGVRTLNPGTHDVQRGVEFLVGAAF